MLKVAAQCHLHGLVHREMKPEERGFQILLEVLTTSHQKCLNRSLALNQMYGVLVVRIIYIKFWSMMLYFFNKVIVKDIVSKNVVAQFRAHKSPISALCFDPSGNILVTTSVQGHNINVFKIMHVRENSSASDAGPSYVHLYRRQHGFTNTVIQDISFSVDSKWIMICSLRGTSHKDQAHKEALEIIMKDRSCT